MGKCRNKQGNYNDNDIVRLSRGLVCYGGFGNPPCQYLEQCVVDNGGVIGSRKRRGKVYRTIKFSRVND